MPTIPQLPAATSVSASDSLPISQAGTARSVTVGTLLASAQPAITVASPSLIGRASVGPGGPEQIGIGRGLTLAGTTIAANGMDHGSFSQASGLTATAEVVISDNGTPMLLPASQLRSLFTPGTNVAISSAGQISAAAAPGSGPSLGSAIGALSVVAGLSSQDLVAISQSGMDRAVAYANFLNGATVNQLQTAAAVGDSDTVVSGQGSAAAVQQSFTAIWSWIAKKLPTYRPPVIEVTANTSLNGSNHNGCVLICSQAVTITLSNGALGNGFACTLINAASANVTLGPGFVTTSGANALAPWQAASIVCATYSGGTVVFASLPAASGTVAAGQPAALSAGSTTSSGITLNWLAPASGTPPFTYTVQYRQTGTTSWATAASGLSTLTFVLASLQAGTSYDVTVAASNAAGTGPFSTVLTASTASAASATAGASTQASTSVTSISWNLLPSGTYSTGSGSIGVNALVTPAASAIEFGFSPSATTPPSTWTAAVHVNSNLWGTYVPAPTSAGTWYVWAQGLDGSALTVSATPFTVH